MTPAARQLLRKERRRGREASRGRLEPQRRVALIDRCCIIIRLSLSEGRAVVVWNLEGPLRAALRRLLCLEGWRWAAADDAARDVLAASFARLGAHCRPAWEEGQSEFVSYGGALIERTRCARCGNPLPDVDVHTRRKFCSDLCKGAYHASIARRREAQDEWSVKDLR